MIHQLLNITRPLFIVDTETTGTDVKVDRIVELGFQMWEPEGPCKHCENLVAAFKNGLIPEIPHCDLCKDTGRVDGGLTKEYRTLINPGVPIPASAAKVHGITDRKVKECQHCGRLREEHGVAVDPTCKFPPAFKQLAANLAKGFSNCDFAGKRVRFDLRIIAAEMGRAGQPWDYVGARVVDIDRLEALLNPRSLSHLHEKYAGRPHDGAHGALSDVRASSKVIAAQLETVGAYDRRPLPRDLDALHQLQWPGWLCDDGQFKMVDGVATCCFGKKWNGRPMREIDVGFYDWILQNDFPADVKHLAAEAKMGRFPK